MNLYKATYCRVTISNDYKEEKTFLASSLIEAAKAHPDAKSIKLLVRKVPIFK